MVCQRGIIWDGMSPRPKRYEYTYTMAFMVHIVNIVTLTNRAKYMIDVSFGGDGTSPLPLKEGLITQNIGTQELRLVYDSIPQQIDKSRKQ